MSRKLSFWEKQAAQGPGSYGCFSGCLGGILTYAVCLFLGAAMTAPENYVSVQTLAGIIAICVGIYWSHRREQWAKSLQKENLPTDEQGEV